MNLIHDSIRVDNVVLWDLDSTLCDTQHRHWIIPVIKRHEKTWDDYSMLCDGDTPIPGAVALMRLMKGFTHIALSARSECAEESTQQWIKKHKIPLSATILRPTGSRVNAGVWKVSQIRKLQKDGFTIALMVEDNRDIAARIIANTDVPVLGVSPFYEDDHTVYGAV